MVAKKTGEPGAEPVTDPGASTERAARKAVKKAVRKAVRKATGKAAAGTPPATKAAAKKSAPKSTAKKSTAKKGTAKKSTARKSTAKKASKKATGAAEAAEQTGVHTVTAKKSASRSTAPPAGGSALPQAGGTATATGELAVRPGEEPWTPEEVTQARTLLTGEAMRLRSELEASGVALAGLMRDSGDGAGQDEADTGTKNITREHELSLAANAQEMLDQTERALARLDAGTYGLCEVCGKPIGKARMQAFPRATLCVEDKQKQERRG